MEEEKRKAYSEVVEILKLIDDEQRIEKIPFEVIELIKRNSDPLYKPTIDKNQPIEDQDLRNETYSILGWIANKYWNEDIIIEPKNEITDEIKDEHQETKTVKETINNIEERAAVYNDLEPKILDYCTQQDNLPILKSDDKWYNKIKDKVIKLLKILFRVKNVKKQSD